MSCNFGFVDNNGPNTVEATIRRLSSRTKQLDAVVAFVTKAGVDAVLPYLHRIAGNGKVSISVGLYQGITEPSALRALHRASKMTAGRLSPSVSRNPTLHRKLYIFSAGHRRIMLVGSSNLTLDGLRSEGEFNVLLQFSKSKGPFNQLIKSIPELSNPKATVPLNDKLISEYERIRNKSRRSGISRSALARLLRIHRRTRNGIGKGHIPNSQQWFRDYVSHFMNKRSEEIVGEQTGWDRRDWGYITAPGGRFAEGDRVLLFDVSKRPVWARVVRIKAVTRTAIPTPDGRQFAAYTEIRRQFSRRKINKKFLLKLGDAGLRLDRLRIRETRVLSKENILAVESTFR